MKIGLSVVICFLLLLPQFLGQDALSKGLEGVIYIVDNQHALMDFTTRHLGFGRVRGTFNEYQASMFLADKGLEASTVTATIDASTLDTGNPGRDDHLKKVFFDVAKYPFIQFQSTEIYRTPEGYRMKGDLTIKDVTKRLEMPLTVVTLHGIDQWENRRIVLETNLVIDRKTFNVVYDNEFWDGIVADEIEIDISFAAFHYNALNNVFPWRKHSIGTFIRDQIPRKGVEATLAEVEQMFEADSSDYKFGIQDFYRAGLGLAQSGQAINGVEVLRLAITVHRESGAPSEIADLYAAMAEVLAGEQRWTEARESVDHALEFDPRHPAALELDRHLKE